MLTVSAPSLPTAFAKKPATTSPTVGLLSLLLKTYTLSILTKMMKLQHEKKPVLNLKNREKEREQALSKHLQNLLRFSFCKNNFFKGKKM